MAVRWITVEATGPVRTIRLHRPPVNALDETALEELADATASVAADAEARVVVLTSALDGVFCSGGDLKFWRSFPQERAREVSHAGRRVFAQVARLEKPTVAAIDGHVVGDGIALALACDLRLASTRTSFRLPETSYGFIPGWGTLHGLVRTIGRARTQDMILTGRAVDARSALEWALVSRVRPVEAFVDALNALVNDLLAMSPTALCLAKMALTENSGVVDGVLEQEAAAFIQSWGGEDWHEGIAALLEKRAPRYTSSASSIPKKGRNP